MQGKEKGNDSTTLWHRFLHVNYIFLILVILGQKQKVTNFLLLFMAVIVSNSGYYSICTADSFEDAVRANCIPDWPRHGILQQSGTGYKRRLLFSEKDFLYEVADHIANALKEHSTDSSTGGYVKRTSEVVRIFTREFGVK